MFLQNACNSCVTIIESSLHWFHQAMMMGDCFPMLFKHWKWLGMGILLNLMKRPINFRKTAIFTSFMVKSKAKNNKKVFTSKECNFHRFCTVFGFHTLAPHELFDGLLPKELGASLIFCGKMFMVFSYQKLCHNAPPPTHHIYATDLRPFG